MPSLTDLATLVRETRDKLAQMFAIDRTTFFRVIGAVTSNARMLASQADEARRKLDGTACAERHADKLVDDGAYCDYDALYATSLALTLQIQFQVVTGIARQYLVGKMTGVQDAFALFGNALTSTMSSVFFWTLRGATAEALTHALAQISQAFDLVAKDPSAALSAATSQLLRGFVAMLNAMLDVTITSAKTSLQMTEGLFGAHDFTLDLASYLRKQLCQSYHPAALRIADAREPLGLVIYADASAWKEVDDPPVGAAVLPISRVQRGGATIFGAPADGPYIFALPADFKPQRMDEMQVDADASKSSQIWSPLLFRPDNVAKPGLCLVINTKFYVHSAPAGVSSEVCEKTWKAIAREDNDEEQHSSNVKCAERMSTFRQRDGEVLCFVTAAFTIVYRTPLLECLAKQSEHDAGAREVHQLFMKLAANDAKVHPTPTIQNDLLVHCPKIPTPVLQRYQSLTNRTAMDGGCEDYLVRAVLEAAHIPVLHAGNKQILFSQDGKKMVWRSLNDGGVAFDTFAQNLSEYTVGMYSVLMGYADIPSVTSSRELIACIHYMQIAGFQTIGVLCTLRSPHGEHAVCIIACQNMGLQLCDAKNDRCMDLANSDDAYNFSEIEQLTFVYLRAAGAATVPPHEIRAQTSERLAHRHDPSSSMKTL
jgi:hypothetical protein